MGALASAAGVAVIYPAGRKAGLNDWHHGVVHHSDRGNGSARGLHGTRVCSVEVPVSPDLPGAPPK